MTDSATIPPGWTTFHPQTRFTRLLRSADGISYRLWLDVPSGSGPEGGWPSLWVLDGASLFVTVSETTRRLARRPDATGVRAMAVIGVDREPANSARRSADYTACPPVENGAMERGEAEAFAAFLAGPAREAAQDAVPLDHARSALLGHSLAGWFALDAAATRPGAFASYGVFSPSLWWNPPVMQAALAAMPDDGQRLFLAVGEREQPPQEIDPRRAARRMVQHAHEAARTAQTRLGPDRTGFHLAPDEDHASTVTTALPAFLRFISKS